MDTVYITDNPNPDTTHCPAMPYAALNAWASGSTRRPAGRDSAMRPDWSGTASASPSHAEISDLRTSPGPGLRHTALPVRRRHHQPGAGRTMQSEKDLGPPWPTRTALCTGCSPPGVAAYDMTSVRDPRMGTFRYTTFCRAGGQDPSTRAASCKDVISGEVHHRPARQAGRT